MSCGRLGLPLLQLLVNWLKTFIVCLPVLKKFSPGPLAGSFPLLSLRTNKATVVVGVDKEVAEELDKSGEKWRSDGRQVFLGSVYSSF